jgi:cytochrome bd-type quinol oxidase subunit 2
VDAPRLRAWLRALGALGFLTSIGCIWLFATGEAGSWRDPKAWPALVRIATIPLIVIGCYLPVFWLNTHASGPETSTRRFAILAAILVVTVVLVMALRATAEPARVAGWLWLAGSILFAGIVARGMWSRVRRGD